MKLRALLGLSPKQPLTYEPMPSKSKCALCREVTYYDIGYDDYSHRPQSSCPIAGLERRIGHLSAHVQRMEKR